MWRLLNLLSVAVLIGSAVFAYTVKYETILYAEQIRKVQNAIAAEQDGIERLRAEWAILTRPERLQTLAEHNLKLQRLALDQIVEAANLPNPPPKVDAIGRKLDSLGLGEPTATPPDQHVPGSAPTPSTAARDRQ